MKKNKEKKQKEKNTSTINKLIKKLFLRFYKDITIFGGTYFYILILTITIILKQYNNAIKLTIAWILITLLSITIRYFYFKPRPKIKKYNNIIEKIDASSFPSMHAGRSTILFLFLTTIIKNPPLQILILFIWINILLSRIILKKHYIIDVIAGTILGIIIYYLVFL